MPTLTDNAICIRCWDFSETSQTVSLFTRGHGVIRGLAKGSKREKGPFSGGLDVLTRGEIVAIVKPGRDLATLTAWHLQETYRAVRTNLAANRAGVYMADLVHHLLVDHDPHPALFDALATALAALGDAERIDRTLLRLQWTALSEAGYQPQIDRDARNGASLPEDSPTFAFSPQAGGLVADFPEAEPSAVGGNDSWRVRRETVDALRYAARDDGRGNDRGGGDRESIRRANRLLAAYARGIIGSEPPAMRWAFGG